MSHQPRSSSSGILPLDHDQLTSIGACKWSLRLILKVQVRGYLVSSQLYSANFTELLLVLFGAAD